jgi:NADH dehydrogenase/NADH:ubiquinone oxidoreductase subunit G
MCLVELGSSLNPVVSCCTLLNDSMVIYTNSRLVILSREHILEFLLLNHPLDCPICDQAGECDLQDLTLVHGSDTSKYRYNKKSILNKNVGTLIKTHMNRCIYCTRCVRYAHELNNTYSFNTLGRGISSEIGNYVLDDILVYDNYVSGNVIDLCPVGALTAKSNTFGNRS